jgi:hypothetical protein
MGDEFIIYSPFLFVLMAGYILLEMIRINLFVKRWELTSLMMIPVLIILLYLWIGIFNPQVEVARLGLRYCIATSLGLSMHVVYCVSKRLRNGGLVPDGLFFLNRH